MRPQTPMPDGSAEQSARLLKEIKDLKAYKRIQVVYLRAKHRGYDRLVPDNGQENLSPISQKRRRRPIS